MAIFILTPVNSGNGDGVVKYVITPVDGNNQKTQQGFLNESITNVVLDTCSVPFINEVSKPENKNKDFLVNINIEVKPIN